MMSKPVVAVCVVSNGGFWGTTKKYGTEADVQLRAMDEGLTEVQVNGEPVARGTLQYGRSYEADDGEQMLFDVKLDGVWLDV